ncbi:MAG: glucosaminidase domain-containing protein [Gemmatimonadaceae bacterium]|nr:glucosaminidase domain-containing protein [Chitinophagaceae bacterium]
MRIMRLKVFLGIVLLSVSAMVKAQPSESVLNYISVYKDLAISEEIRTGVPAAIKLAQGIHETEAGNSVLVRKSNNHFGIKCKTGWEGEKVYHDDDARGECFRSYPAPDDSYRDHSDFLRRSTRYAFLFELDPTDYKEWAFGLKKAGYATNIKYSHILIKLIETYNLQQYTLIALGKLKPAEEVLVSNENTSSTVTGAMQPNASVKATEPVVKVRPQFPPGEFTINRTRVIFVEAGSSLLALADKYEIPLARLLDFNDLPDNAVLESDQLIFLQRKRKVAENALHIVTPGETVYDICQLEGIRMESLLNLNHLSQGMEPAAGEKLYLRDQAPSRPALMTKVISSNKEPLSKN